MRSPPAACMRWNNLTSGSMTFERKWCMIEAEKVFYERRDFYVSDFQG